MISMKKEETIKSFRWIICVNLLIVDVLLQSVRYRRNDPIRSFSDMGCPRTVTSPASFSYSAPRHTSAVCVCLHRLSRYGQGDHTECRRTGASSRRTPYRVPGLRRGA